MTDLFVDSSAIIAVAFGEEFAPDLKARLAGASQVLASALLEAEVRSVCRREGRRVEPHLLEGIRLIHPPHSLTAEIDRVLDAGYASGADCWHLATALFSVGDARQATFLTLDARQRAVAKKLGFRV